MLSRPATARCLMHTETTAARPPTRAMPLTRPAFMQKARKKNAMAQRRTGTLWGAPAAGFGTPCPGCCKSLSFIVTFITSIREKPQKGPGAFPDFPFISL